MPTIKKLNNRSFNDYDSKSCYVDNRYVQSVNIEKRIKLAVSCAIRKYGTRTCTTEQIKDAMNSRVRSDCYTSSDVRYALDRAHENIPGVMRYLGKGKWQFKADAIDKLTETEWVNING